MSEFIAEAQVLITPDTTKFAAELRAAVAAATAKPIPVTVTPVVAGAGNVSGIFGNTAVQAAAATQSVKAFSAAEVEGQKRAKEFASQQQETARQMGQVEKAAFASAASLAGLRGAVLTAGGAFLGATVAFQGLGKAISSASNLEQTFNVFRVTAQATAEEMENVRDQAKALGRDLALPGVTAQDAAESMLTLARAGLTVEQAIDGARGTLQLAVAAQISFADSAQLTASALNAFGLEGDKAVDVADLLTNAANASQASISEMGIALQQSAAIADLAGFSLSETVTFLTELAQAGLRGSDAGTSFRVAIQRLIAPTDDARAALDKLHLNLRDVNGDVRPEAFFELGRALDNMSRAQADATRQTIFGNDASRAAAFFARINTAEFRNQEKELTRQGAAAEVAAARNQGFAGSVENAKNQVAAFGIEIGGLALPALGSTLDITALFFGALADQISDTRKAFAGFNDDAKQIQEFLRETSNDSGFTQFAKDVASGARLIEGDIEHAESAIGGFVKGLLGVGDSADKAVPPVQRLVEQQGRLPFVIADSVDALQQEQRALDSAAAAADRTARSVQRLTGQIAGLSEKAQRARIAGDESGQVSALEAERDRIQKLIDIEDKIVAAGGNGAATARERIRNELLPQLESVNNEIRRIFEENAADAKNAAADAKRSRDEADNAFLELLSNRRDDQERRVSRAGETAGLVDDIRAQNNLQALIRQQISKIRDRVKDEKARRDAVRELRIALIASRAEEKRLREEQAQQAKGQAQEILDIKIQIAEVKGQEALERQLLNQKIKSLRKRIKDAKGNRLLIAQLQLELAQTQKQLADLNKQQEDTAKDARKSAAQFFFEQLQAQQGFVGNLLGNLITGSTAGLVGNASPTGQPIQHAIKTSAATEKGRALGGPTAGQASTTNVLLERIWRQLQNLNGAREHPEAQNERRRQRANMDGIGGGGGGSAVM